MARCLALALVSLVIAGTTVPMFDLTRLFDRLTVPLGTVPVTD
jgi:hypothetical protein